MVQSWPVDGAPHELGHVVLLAVVRDSRALTVALEFVQLAVAPRSTIARDLQHLECV